MRPLQTHYTFGDLDLAAERLWHLARLFEPALLEFLRRTETPRDPRMLDLGCGPGYTTEALWHTLRPTTLVGIDGSERFLARARAQAPPGIQYELGDVTTMDVADRQVDLVYARFLLTHLPDPAAALSHWAGAVAHGGRVLIQETADLSSDHPALGRYYEFVGELQRRHGQSLHIGRELSNLADPARYRVVRHDLTPVHVPAYAMARLHAMNIPNWRHDAEAGDFDAGEVDRLTADLRALSDDTATSARVHYSMGEMVLERS